MKRDLLRKYVWLIEVIRHAGKITFEEINEQWIKSPLNLDHSPLALRTFHNHREAIEHMFGIRIQCGRTTGNRYYLEDCETGEISRLKIWMLQTLGISHLALKNNDVPERMLFDAIPAEKYGIITIIEAMEANHKIEMECDLSPEKKPMLLEPYALRLWKNDWYLLAKNEEAGQLQSFNMRYTRSISISPEKFSLPYDFDANKYFEHSFGPFVDDAVPVEDIRIRVKGFDRDRFRIEPLHPSQKEVETEGDTSVFEYLFRPTDDFMRAILSLGTNAEVLSPISLRKQISDRLKTAVDVYKS